jgi:hypothetical protein
MLSGRRYQADRQSRKSIIQAAITGGEPLVLFKP